MTEICLLEPPIGENPINPTMPPAPETPVPSPSPSPTAEAEATPTATPEITATPEVIAAPEATAVPTSAPDATAVLAGTAAPDDTFLAGSVLTGGPQVPWLVALIVCAAFAALAAFITGRIVKRSVLKRRRAAPAAMAKTTPPAPAGTVTGMAIGNTHNIGARENQEDAFGISDLSDERQCRERGVLCVVADGMGGLSKGEEVSAAVVSAMRERFQNAPDGCTPPQLRLSLTEQANEAVNMLTGGVAGQCGSTMLAVLVRFDQLWFASVGDSRICLCRGGSLLQLTREHTYAVDLDMSAGKGAITFEEAADNSQRHALTRYIGMGALEGIDFNMRPVRLLPGDRVILMSDGVFNALSDAEIASALRGSAQEAACALESAVLAKQAPRQDNFTAIILQFK